MPYDLSDFHRSQRVDSKENVMGTPPSLMMVFISVILQGLWYYSCKWQGIGEFQGLTHSQWFSIRGNFTLLGDIWQCLEMVLVVTTYVPLASNGERTEMLLNILQCPGNATQQRIVWFQMAVALRLTVPTTVTLIHRTGHRFEDAARAKYICLDYTFRNQGNNHKAGIQSHWTHH